MSACRPAPFASTQPDSAAGHDAAQGHDAALTVPSPPHSLLVLDATTVEAIAQRTAELLREPSRPTGKRVDAARVAEALGVTRQWVYEHAEELGGERLSESARSRWRFDLEAVLSARTCSSSKQSQAQDASAQAESERVQPKRGRRLPSHRPQPGSVLPIRPRSNGQEAATHAA